MKPSITDSHVHVWDPARFRYAWLDGFPDLNRAFALADFKQASESANVGKMIFVESGCEPAQSIAEVDWIAELAKVEPRLKGIVAHAALEKGAAVRAELRTLADRALVKGIRRNLQGEYDLGFCLRPEFITGVNVLAEFGFTFDLCIRPEQLRDAVELARRAPLVTFVLDHLAKPGIRGRQAGTWGADLGTLAVLPNVVCKISGLATEADWNTWRAADLKPYVEWAIECFGFDRILFGGDWPVATLATSYGRWLETVEGIVATASVADQLKLFQTNAERIYRV